MPTAHEQEFSHPSVPECEILSTRVIDAPRERVFQAATDPKLLAQWWGPQGFTNTFQEFDLRPGGYWRFIMHGPDGKDYSNESSFMEIKKNERIVFDHISDPKFIMVLSFEEHAGKTKFGFRMIFQSEEFCKSMRAFIEGANEQNFDRLQAVLAQMK